MTTQTEAPVTVSCGVDSETSPELAGMTVAQLREMFRHTMNIGPHAVAVVRGKEVGEDYVAKPGDSVEFVKKDITKAV